MISLKGKIFFRFKICFFLLCFGLSVFLVGYLYLNSQLERIYTSNKTESVPYYQTPENKTFLINICQDSVLINFDFQESIVNVFLQPEISSAQTEVYGYKIDYQLNGDYGFVGYIVDSVGGISLERNDEILRYTGTQITEMLEYSNVSKELKLEIIKKTILSVSGIGFTKENLLYIIENYTTDLKFSDGILFVNNIADCCKFPRFIN